MGQVPQTSLRCLPGPRLQVGGHSVRSALEVPGWEAQPQLPLLDRNLIPSLHPSWVYSPLPQTSTASLASTPGGRIPGTQDGSHQRDQASFCTGQRQEAGHSLGHNRTCGQEATFCTTSLPPQSSQSFHVQGSFPHSLGGLSSGMLLPYLFDPILLVATLHPTAFGTPSMVPPGSDRLTLGPSGHCIPLNFPFN